MPLRCVEHGLIPTGELLCPRCADRHLFGDTFGGFIHGLMKPVGVVKSDQTELEVFICE